MIIYVIIDTDGELEGAFSSMEKAIKVIQCKNHPEDCYIYATILDE